MLSNAFLTNFSEENGIYRVYLKMEMLLLFTRLPVTQNLYDFCRTQGTFF